MSRAMPSVVPAQFTEEYVKANSPVEEQLYSSLLKSGQPYKSIYRSNYHTSAKYGFVNRPVAKDGTLRGRPETPGLDLLDQDLYYNSQGAAQAYWATNGPLPAPTKDIHQLRRDMKRYGYCLVEEALSVAQLTHMQKRTADQLEGERLAGVAMMLPDGNQFLHGILNKDPEGLFAKCFVHDPEGVQAGVLIEQLIGEAIGEDFIGSSFLGIVAHKHAQPQGLHQDQGVLHVGGVQEAPWSCNCMYVLDDFSADNGGTLVVPTSHLLISAPGAGNPVPPLPPAANLTCPAGTCVLFEGRLLHGTGVNRTDQPRRMFVANCLKPQFRQQEMWALSLAPEVLAKASPKLLYRCGLRPTGLGGVEGDWSPDPENGLRTWREAMDRGEYVRVGVLSPDSSAEELGRDYTLRHTKTGQNWAETGQKLTQRTSAAAAKL